MEELGLNGNSTVVHNSLLIVSIVQWSRKPISRDRRLSGGSNSQKAWLCASHPENQEQLNKNLSN